MTDKGKVNRRWLVRNRSKIQHRMLRLDEFGEAVRQDQLCKSFYWYPFLTMIGITFSLWRAVFLVQKERLHLEEMDHGTRMLRTVIETNAIGFPQDNASAQWTAGYYIEDAAIRLYMLAKIPGGRFVLKKSTLQEIEFWPTRLADPEADIISFASLWERCLKHFDQVFREMREDFEERFPAAQRKATADEAD